MGVVKFLSWMRDKDFYRPPPDGSQNWHITGGRRWGRSYLVAMIAAFEEALDIGAQVLAVTSNAQRASLLEGIGREQLPRFVHRGAAPVLSAQSGVLRERTRYLSGERVRGASATTLILEDPSCWSDNKRNIVTPLFKRAERVLTIDVSDVTPYPELESQGFLRLPTWLEQDVSLRSDYSRTTFWAEFGGYSTTTERVVVPRRLVDLLAQKGLTLERFLCYAFEELEPGLE